MICCLKFQEVQGYLESFKDHLEVEVFLLFSHFNKSGTALLQNSDGFTSFVVVYKMVDYV